MALNLADLLKGERKVKVKVRNGEEEQEFEVRYNPAKRTPKMERSIGDVKLISEVYVNVLENLLIGWDIIEDANQTAMPVSRETLEGLPNFVLEAITQAIREDEAAKK